MHRRKSNHRIAHKHARRLAVQTLESRQLFAGNSALAPVDVVETSTVRVAAEVAEDAPVRDVCGCEVICGLTANGDSPFCPSNRAQAAADALKGRSIDPISNPDKFTHDDHHRSTTGSSVDPLSDPGKFRHEDHQQPNRGSISPITHPKNFNHPSHGLNPGLNSSLPHQPAAATRASAATELDPQQLDELFRLVDQEASNYADSLLKAFDAGE
jgi:hypothetical protein